MRKNIIMMSPREIMRLQAIQKTLGKEINQQEVAEILRISDRQVRRVIKWVREEGTDNVRHKM